MDHEKVKEIEKLVPGQAFPEGADKNSFILTPDYIQQSK